MSYKFFGVCDIVVADFEAAEGGKVGAGAEGLADVFGESADVGAGAAVDADFEFGVGVAQDFDIVNRD